MSDLLKRSRMRWNLTTIFENGPCGKRRSPFSHACLLSSLLPEGKEVSSAETGFSVGNLSWGGGEGELDNIISVATLGFEYQTRKFMRGGTWRRGGHLVEPKRGCVVYVLEGEREKGVSCGLHVMSRMLI